jgi:hypothetical protein
MLTLSGLTAFLFEINAAIDTGKYADVSVDEVEDHIERGDLLPYLRARLGDDIDLSRIDDEREAVLGAWLIDILNGNKGRESRKWGVRNHGLCLLVAWTAELIQQRVWEQSPSTSAPKIEVARKSAVSSTQRIIHPMPLNLDRKKIQKPFFGRPHVYILGAGASYAAFPHGDKNGRRLPLMHNIVDVVGLRPVLHAAGINYKNENFETLYSTLVADGQQQALVAAVERQIADYFSGMELPHEPTLYDHLVLSTRAKDIIATFNWDPFLVQAWRRNCGKSGMGPKMLFLHGNTAIGYCMEHKPMRVGKRGDSCPQCNKTFQESRLLYPIAQKNYSVDPFISKSWEMLRVAMKHAYVLTIFGYGAPASDLEAISLMKDAWGKQEERQFEEVEIIDIKPEEELRERWDPFILTHHYRTTSTFYDSLTATHPRRTCEALWQQLMEVEFIDPNPPPHTANWHDLRTWYELLFEDERQAEQMASTSNPS